VKKILVCFFVFSLCLTHTSFAANARTDGAGKLYILSDLSNVLGHPASINDFPDQFMGTAGTYNDTDGTKTEYYGAFIAKKSIGKIFNLGLIANTMDDCGSSVLNSDFYNNARLFLLDDTTDSDETLPNSFPMIPRLLFGLDFEAFRFGIEFFMEMARYKYSVTGDTKKNVDKGVYNFGSRMSSTVVINNFWFCLFFGFGIPQIHGTVEEDTITHSYESLKDSYRGYGGELGICIKKATLVGGAYYTNEQYMFKKGTRKSFDYKTDFYFIYLGIKNKILKDMLFGFEYNLTLWHEDILDPNTVNTSDYFGRYTYHDFHTGIEKPFKGKKIFDVVALRSGMIYSIENIVEKYKYSDNAIQDVTINYPINAQELKLNAGIGFQKHVFCLDLFVNIGNWDGVFTGPRTASATITIGLSQEFLDKDRLKR